MDPFLACVLAIAGLVLGSFLNVCITRIPRDESVVSPGSHCPRCGKPIRWYHNFPVISFLILRGRCAHCRERISIRYPMVEVLTAVLFVACFARFGINAELLKFSVFSFLLVGLIFMDAETGLLPREFTYPGIALGLLFAWFVPGDGTGARFLLRSLRLHPNLSQPQFSLLDAAIAILVSAGFFYVMWAVYYLVRKRHGIGFGDIALIAMCGAFLGLKLTLFVLFSAPVIGSLFGIALLLRNPAGRAGESPESGEARLSTLEMLRTSQIPFGVFLGGCSLLAVFFGDAAWRWYLARIVFG